MVKILNERYLTLAEVREILEKKEREGELSDIEQITLDYVKKFSKVKAIEAAKLVEKLVNEYGIDKEIAIQVVNIMPGSLEELRSILSTSRKFVSTEEAESILNLLKEFSEEKR
ncbi:MAG: hypothetical protein B6U69_01575 [Thermofilum sp. ex4484_15]|nr:MAG: hypothetical protein B6U69_01575 [Thermofilum sp. ex4484_15]